MMSVVTTLNEMRDIVCLLSTNRSSSCPASGRAVHHVVPAWQPAGLFNLAIEFHAAQAYHFNVAFLAAGR